MTLQTSGTMTDADLMAEIRTANPGRAYPLSLTDPDVLALAGKSAPPVTFPTDFYGKSAYTPMAVTGHGDNASVSTFSSGGTIACAPSVTVTGGKNPKTYLWSFTSNPNGCVLNSTTSATCSVSHTYNKGSTGFASAQLQCQVSDGTTTVTATGITATLDWDS